MINVISEISIILSGFMQGPLEQILSRIYQKLGCRECVP